MISDPEPEPRPRSMLRMQANAVGFVLQRIGKFAVSRLPRGWGFIIFAFPFDGTEGLRYVSNGSREAVLKLLEQFVQKAKDRPNEKPKPPPA